MLLQKKTKDKQYDGRVAVKTVGREHYNQKSCLIYQIQIVSSKIHDCYIISNSYVTTSNH